MTGLAVQGSLREHTAGPQAAFLLTLTLTGEVLHLTWDGAAFQTSYGPMKALGTLCFIQRG